MPGRWIALFVLFCGVLRGGRLRRRRAAGAGAEPGRLIRTPGGVHDDGVRA